MERAAIEKKLQNFSVKFVNKHKFDSNSSKISIGEKNEKKIKTTQRKKNLAKTIKN